MNAIFDMIRYVTHNQASFEPGLVLIVFFKILAAAFSNLVKG